ncbi:Beta-transducin family (WD-40 repeat) protein [Dioscorea alata]|uniref:Beta-transducin family (WD-40 repeat) protein n=1 Tax=Dioscorea alata TaxID=55571 RepID=A0ACB7U620_DIOAL|nr:Beta-transducin family (WD-40 repeat) protein [Dioscorea alata]
MIQTQGKRDSPRQTRAGSASAASSTSGSGSGSGSDSDDRDTAVSIPSVPPFNCRPFSRLISFPNNDILSDLTDDQLNALIFQYFQEKGFEHAAFNFGIEAEIEDVPIDRSIINKGALPSFVRKGLRYTQLKANVLASDVNSFGECCRLDPLDIITNNVDSLSKIIKDRKENAKKKDNDGEKDIYCGVSDQEKESEKQKLGKEKEHVQDMRMQQVSMHSEDQCEVDVHGGPPLIAHTPSLPSMTHQVSDSNVYVFEGHGLQVASCAWSPTDSLLAVGYFSSAARIWKISDDISSMHSSLLSVYVLNDYNAKTDGQSGSITNLAWNGEGELLATGSFEGQISIWSKNGELKKTLKHKDSIFFLEWNRKGDFLLAVSSDYKVMVWDTNKWESKQELAFNSEQLLGVAWRNDTSFALLSEKQRIYVFNVGECLPIKTFSGHQKVIGGFKWDPTGTFLASYSIDGAIKIWTFNRRRSLHNLMHSPSVCSIKWSPTGPGTDNPDKQLLLASASSDGTVKIWDCNQWHLLYSFDGHREPVTLIEFSPDGELMASGADDQTLFIWKVKDGTILRSCSCYESMVYIVSWNREGNKLAAVFENDTVCVIGLSLDDSSVH